MNFDTFARTPFPPKTLRRFLDMPEKKGRMKNCMPVFRQGAMFPETGSAGLVEPHTQGTTAECRPVSQCNRGGVQYGYRHSKVV
jgi:hypothetical protein